MLGSSPRSMNTRPKPLAGDFVTCEKYISRIMSKDKPQRKARATESNIPKQTSPIQNRIKSLKNRIVSPVPPARPPPNAQNIQTVPCRDTDLTDLKACRTRKRSSSSCSATSNREPWGQLLLSNKTRDSPSTFSNFDPLRTLHFLSKELHVKVQDIMPEDSEVQQIVQDIHLALKRIPPEVASLIHLKATESKSMRCLYQEKIGEVKLLSKFCQTPPTLYQEDRDGFHQMIEENAQKLAISCQQLEKVCTNLQREKDITDKELEAAQYNVRSLSKKVKELEKELETSSPAKVSRLEKEKQLLEEKIAGLMEEVGDTSRLNSLQKLVEEMREEKHDSDQIRAKLEYDMTLLSLEKEKFVTMLSVRDREIKDIQEEMSRIQEQVTSELNKLHGEVISRVSSVKSLQGENVCDLTKDKIGVGDATLSSIQSEDDLHSDKGLTKEAPSGGDAAVPRKTSDNCIEKLQERFSAKLKQFHENKDNKQAPPTNDPEASIQVLLKEIKKVNIPVLAKRKT